ncbi:MAG: hypothetical protein ACP5LW_03335 [Nitrososphaeria archaeon]
MPRKAIKLEFEDENGAKYLFKVEGNIEKDKVLRLLELYELISESEQEKKAEDITVADSDLYSLLRKIIREMPLTGFTSKDIQSVLEDRYSISVKLPIISTYLRRMNDRGELVRRKEGREWVYQLREIQNVTLLKKKVKK